MMTYEDLTDLPAPESWPRLLSNFSSNQRLLTYLDPHPQDILGLEGPGVLEEDTATTLALRPPFSDLARLMMPPPFRFKVGMREGRSKLELSECPVPTHLTLPGDRNSGLTFRAAESSLSQFPASLG
jgi:hypothetical protein